jgi:hypothetical protein
MTNSNVVSGMFQLTGADRDLRQKNGASGVSEHYVIKAEHIVHLSLSEGLDINYPFGQSILEPIFKTFKQKELLEDSIIIYRVQRAPERRVFKIDCGQMSPQRARAHVEAVKNEIHQRRIPNRTGGGASVVDATYNPLATIEDYFFAVGSEGRGSSVETLPGGDNLGEIGDLTFFSKKMARGLGIPANYLSLSDDQTGGAAYNDGKMGAAMIQEFRFNKYCMRLQSLLASTFDKEFKKFLNINGFEIDSDLFELQFNPPQNFAKYRQIEIDTAQAQVYSSVSGNPKMAERMKFKKYLGWTDDDILENERLWREENPDKIKKKTGTTPAESNNEGDLSAVGIRPGDDFDMGGEMPTDDLGDDVGGDQPEGAAPPEGGAGAPPPAPDKPTL